MMAQVQEKESKSFLERKYERALGLFRKFVESVAGKKGDARSRVAVLADPDNIQTMSILSKNECDFVSIAKWMHKEETWGDMWEGLERFADQILYTNISYLGQGREQSIRFVGALSEAKLLKQLGITTEVKGEGKD